MGTREGKRKARLVPLALSIKRTKLNLIRCLQGGGKCEVYPVPCDPHVLLAMGDSARIEPSRANVVVLAIDCGLRSKRLCCIESYKL